MWLADTRAKTLSIEPSSPWENGFCEIFNSKLHDEFLNGEIFYSLKEITGFAERWRVLYNTIRPRSSLGYKHRATAPHPVAMMRALALVWLFAGLPRGEPPVALSAVPLTLRGLTIG